MTGGPGFGEVAPPSTELPVGRVDRDWRFWSGLVVGMAGLATYHSLSFVPTYPVSGRVLVAGEPASGAVVEFHPLGGLGLLVGRPRARAREDGSFELATRPDRPGAPAGDYAVTVEWRAVLGVGDERASGPNRAPAIYARRESTPLRAAVVEGKNRLPDLRIGGHPPRRVALSTRTREEKP